MELHDLRINYGKGEIDDRNLPESPFGWFGEWLADAISKGLPEANAMVLSTVSDLGKPSSRIVLLKAFDERGFLFFTNYSSRKGHNITLNPAGSLLFFWPELERQVRVEGIILKADPVTSDEYFYSRPLESRVSAAVSPQSAEVPSRIYLEKMHKDFLESLKDDKVQRPDNWGGYWLFPELVEFWQGRRNRLHDRIQYDRSDSEWKRCRLAP